MKNLQEHTHRNFGLDLCRCLAICLVLFVHTGQIIFQQAFPFLWYLPIGGVELFFSLSGFLIGRILLTLFEKESVTFRDIGRFWAQRWFRTIPLYYILYFVYLLCDNLFLESVQFDPRYLFFLHNFTTSPPPFFGESSTLSIEEWFYFTVPLLIYLLLLLVKSIKKFCLDGSCSFLVVAFMLILGSILLRFQYFNTGRFVAVSVIFRMDAIAYGLLMAFLSTRIVRLEKGKAIATVIAGIILWCIAAIIRMKFFYGLPEQSYYIFSGMGTALVVLGFYYIHFQIQSIAVTYISKISYSIYLLHLTGIAIPLAYFFPVNDKVSQWLMFLLALIMTFVLSSLIYHFIEKPFLRLRGKLVPKKHRK